MKMPIPDDWNGQDWACFQIRWPDSPRWIALLMGFLSQPSHGYFWDERSGTVTSVQQIGREIWGENFPFTDCAGEIIPPDETTTVYIATEDCDDCEDCEMGCSIPYGALRINKTTGALEYLYCGEWYAVEDWEFAQIGDQPNQPDDDDTDPDDPPAPEMNCQKAYWIAHEYARFMQSCYERYYETPRTVFAWSNIVRSDMAGYSISNWSIWKMYEAVQIIGAVEILWNELFTDVDMTQLICLFAPVLNPDNYALTRAEYDAMKSIVSGWSNATTRVYMTTAFDVLNYSNFQKMAFDARSQADYDCECGEVLPPDTYDGDVYFLGNLISADTPSRISQLYTTNNGKKLHVVWTAPAGQFISDASFKTGIHMNSPITSVKIALRSLSGNAAPTAEWRVDPQCLDPLEWRYMRFGSAWTHTPAAVNGEQHTLVTANTPPASDTDVELYFRKCPSIADSPAKTYELEYEIIEINGTPV